MYIPVRRSLGLVLSGIAVLGPLNAKGQAQFRPGTINPAPSNPAVGLSPNPYVNPFASGLTRPLTTLTGYGLGLNPGANFGALSGASSPYSQLGYGSLSNGGGSGIYGGSGGLASSLLSSAVSGAGYSYGYGASNAQWMMNPYQGYLQGAADITRAQADYWKGIQQAKLTQQEAIRSSIQTRRAMIEEADWERAHMPDPEKIRQQALQRELTRARVSPPLNDVWSARALNALLRHLITQLEEGAREPSVPIGDDTVKHINVKAGGAVGNIVLLKNKGELEWPESLQASAFQESREQLNALMHKAYRSVDSGNNPDPTTLNELLAQFRKVRDTLKSNVSELKPDDYIEAQRYLNEVGQTIKGLQDPNVGRQFSDAGKPTEARSVAELVKHMRDKGLLFAPASKSDEAAYVALYHALAAFDAGLGRIVRGAQQP